MLARLIDHPLAPFVVGTMATALLTQVWKAAARAAGIRHHRAVERTLSLVPAALGAVLFGAFPHELAVDALVDGGHHALHALGAILGAGVGFISSGIYRSALDLLPEHVRERLTLPDQEGDDGS